MKNARRLDRLTTRKTARQGVFRRLLKTAIREKWSKRELERQFRGALFERAMLNPPKVSAVLRQMQPEAHKVLKDTYLLEYRLLHRLQLVVGIA